ncbi:MAG TPA: molybdopterin-dependent oxidoreductase [Candidatus Limnocylindria bacterium]|nr:molybdopterin-dependent oxidoreductase [Candidatus Limnocylindria bacterium]
MTDHIEPATPGPSRSAAALAGLVAGALGVGVGELIAGLVPGAPSPVLSIGSGVIELQPPGAKQFVVDLFGQADKLVLNLVVAGVALAGAAALGVLAVRRWNLAVAGFVAAGVLAFAASRVEGATNDLVLSALTSAGAVTVAVYALRWLLHLAAPRPVRAEMPDFGRRHFLGGAVAIAGVAAGSGVVGRLLLERRASAVAAVPPVPPPGATLPPLPSGANLSVPGLGPIVTPNDQFYRVDVELLVPRLDAATWQLTVNGMVDRPFSIGYAELLSMPLIEQYVTIACVSNQVGGDLVGNAKWRGVRLRDLLDRAGLQHGATQIVGRAHDGWTAGFPTSWIQTPEREAMVAVAMNDEPLPPDHGYPARLIVPGLFGYVSATKWLTNIELTTLEAFDAYWVPRGWAKEGPILTQSRIDVPRDGQAVAAGTVAVAGVAWAPDRGIEGVEVQVDDGTWAEAELSAPISPATWVQWLYRWEATPGDHVVRVRATDATGEVQTAAMTRPDPDGARGHHTISVRVD